MNNKKIVMLVGSFNEKIERPEIIWVQRKCDIFTIPDGKINEYKNNVFLRAKYQVMLHDYYLTDMKSISRTLKQMCWEPFIQIDCPDYEPSMFPKLKEFVKELKKKKINSIVHSCGNGDLESIIKAEPDYLNVDIVNNPNLLNIYKDVIVKNKTKLIIGIIDYVSKKKNLSIPDEIKEQIVGYSSSCGLPRASYKTVEKIIDYLLKVAGREK